jgi:mono/diheme cytochrome c family protein
MERMRQIYRALILSVLMLAALPRARAAEDETLFRGQVGPIFASRCLACHKGDHPKGGLSLTTRESLLKGGEGGAAIVPGKPDESLLIQYVSGDKPDMPKNGAALSAAQVTTLRNWIAADAPWPADLVLQDTQRAGPDWWAFQPIGRPSPPAVKDPAWVRNPIDAFVLARLDGAGLRPAARAEKLTLLRRATFDLIGLPPTPQECDAFLADETPQAFANVVDRLLASPHYGERWGRHWLDVVHYADTHGFESDRKRPDAWRYRDYVIDAFNRDKPFDRFLSEQIAGDVLDPSNPQAIAALGFLGTGPWDQIGHEAKASDLRRRARADELDDIVNTVVATTLGLTLNCARCHDHKFDPLPQRDYYRVVAVFAGVKHGERPLRSAASEERARQLADLKLALARIKAELGRIDHAPLDLADIVAGGNGFGSGERDRGIDPRSGEASSGRLGILPGLQVNKFTPSHLPLVDGIVVPNGASPISSTGIVIPTRATDGQSWDYVQAGKVLSQDTAEIDGVDYAAAPHAMIALHANKALTFDLAAIRQALPQYRALRFQAVAAYGGLGAGADADFAVYVDGTLRAERRNINHASGGTALDLPLAADERFLTLVATDGGNVIAFDQIFFGDPRLVPDQPAIAVAADSAVAADGALAADGASAPDSAAKTALHDQRRAIEKQLADLTVDEKVYAVVSQEPAATHLLKRGDPESPAEEVSPGALSVVQSLSADLAATQSPEQERRAALATWLTDPANPLVRRVAVNRLWHYHFGTGLVATPSDFGFNGDRPSHPELLDWLASELLDQRWSLKQLQRTIMLSSTYQQSCAPNETAETSDRGNRLLWRMNRRRLEAEAVRDAVLAVSGKLNPQHGGSPFEDFVYIEKYAPVYQYIVADRPELWRRTVYRFAVRSVPNPWLEALDCPNPSIQTPARNRTTTALQALALLNNPFVLQQSRYFAERLRSEAPDRLPEQVRLAYRLAFAREASDQEAAEAIDFVASHDLTELCHLLFNASEFVYVD